MVIPMKLQYLLRHRMNMSKIEIQIRKLIMDRVIMQLFGRKVLVMKVFFIILLLALKLVPLESLLKLTYKIQEFLILQRIMLQIYLLVISLKLFSFLYQMHGILQKVRLQYLIQEIAIAIKLLLQLIDITIMTSRMNQPPRSIFILNYLSPGA